MKHPSEQSLDDQISNMFEQELIKATLESILDFIRLCGYEFRAGMNDFEVLEKTLSQEVS